MAQHENPFSTAIQRSQQFLDASQNIAFSKESEKIECKVPANNHNVSETFLSTETNVGDQKPRTYENLRRLLEKTRDEEDCSSDDQFVDVESVDDGGDEQKPNFLVSAKTIPSPADCVSSELMDTVTTKSFGTEEQQLVSSANKNLFCLVCILILFFNILCTNALKNS